MSEIFISYARSTAAQAQQIAALLRTLGYQVWLDNQLPAHRSYAQVIEERLKAAQAVLVLWSADAVKSEWVQSEADRARNYRKLVQLTLDGSPLPMPFDRIECADLARWNGDQAAPGWSKVLASLAELAGRQDGAPPRVSPTPAILALPPKPSIAVLPFANLSGDPGQSHFVDGMVEEITNALSRFPTLFVIASGSALGYREAARDLKAIGRELGVRYLLEGSVRKSENKVRISVKLVEAEEGAQIWTERFDDTLDDVFELQDRVASHVAAVLDVTLESAEIRRAARRPTEDVDAYELYLGAVSCWRAWGPDSLGKAVQMADAAVARDPGYAWALVMAAFCRSNLYFAGSSADSQALRERGLAQCRRGLSLAQDDPLVLAWAALTLMNFLDDIDAAQRLSERALAGSPGSAITLHVSGWAHAVNGDPEHAITRLEQALRLDPRSSLNPYHLTGIGVGLFALGRFDEAAARFSDAIHSVPEYPTPRLFRAACHAHQGRLAEARNDLGGINPATLDFLLKFVREPQRLALLKAGIALAAGERTM